MTAASPRVHRAEPKPSGHGSSIRRWAATAPALLAMLGIVLFGLTVAFQKPDRTQAHYREEADAALAAEDYTTARLCFERLLQTTQNDPALWYGLARSLDGLHQLSESSAILARIAPVDAPGYTPAQFWLAEQLLESRHDDQSNRLAEQHLRRVLDAEPGNVDAQSLLAELAAKRNGSRTAR